MGVLQNLRDLVQTPTKVLEEQWVLLASFPW